MEERRRHPRKTVSWLARLWLNEDWFTVAKTVNASMHGLCLAISQRIPATALKPGQRYRLEVRTEPDGEIVFTGTLRDANAIGMGFEIDETVPLDARQRAHASPHQGQAVTPARK
jgi:PilZ domain